MTVLRTNTIAGIGETFGPLLDGDLEFNSQNYIVLPKGSSNQQGVLRTTEDVIGVGGTYYDNLVLAMPFNEATGLRDVSSRNRNPAAYGNVAISTAQSKYYGSSAYFDGTDDIVRIAGIGSDFAFDDKNFTVEGYFRSNNVSATTIPIALTNLTVSSNADASWYIRFISNKIEGKAFSGSNEIGVTTYSSTSNDIWYHVAYVRSGSTFTLYVDGNSADSVTSSGSLNYYNTWKVDVGHGYGGANYFYGYIQDLRIYKGLAKYTANFTPPERIAEIGVGFKTGALRYNTDSNKVELYDGSQWAEVQSSRPDLNGGARGVFGGSYSYGPSSRPTSNVIDYINISSTGNAIDFGDLTSPRGTAQGCSSSTRGVWMGGDTSSGPTYRTDDINYVTISSTGNAIDFGDVSSSFVGHGSGSCSNSTRGIVGGGNYLPTLTNSIHYITISSTGNSVDFGDLTIPKYGLASVASPTRGVFGAGDASPATSNIIDFVTISTLGNAQDFGDQSSPGTYSGYGACSNPIRGLFANAIGPTSTINYIMIATTGNTQNFGNLTTTDGRRFLSACASSTRGVFAGGYSNSAPTYPLDVDKVIEYVTVSTEGNAVDFGDLTVEKAMSGGCSNAHGGL